MSDQEIITIPYRYKPYDHQVDLFAARDQGIKHLFTRWHRRSGKDLTFWNLLIREAVKRRGIYYYVFPQLKQGKKVLFEGMTSDGDLFMDYVPESLRNGDPNSTELKIKLSNNSLIQIVGTDNYDKVRGTNPVGVVYSEFAYQNPGAREVIRPILLANGGWEAINSTPNGKNHMYELEERSRKFTKEDISLDRKWFISIKTIEDTYKHDGSPIFTKDMYAAELDSGYSEEFLQQEYYVSYTANSQGYYYLKYLNDARETDRISIFPWIPDLPVYTYWDIGVGDSTAIWFLQWQDKIPTIIDFYYNFSVGIDHYASILLNGSRAKYAYKQHVFPHDMINTEFGTGKTRMEIAEGFFGRDKVTLGPKLSFEDGIQASRSFIQKCRFDENENTIKGIRALENYQREWSDERKEFSARPLHNWASHPADSFRYMAVDAEKPRERTYLSERLRQYRKKFGKHSWKVA
jgi:phage terminase large subunit